MAEQKKPKIISIVGGGVSAAHIIEMLRTKYQPDMPPIEIHVYEKDNGFVEGLAWSPDNVEPFHLVNTYVSANGKNEVINGLNSLPDTRVKGDISRIGEVSRDVMGVYHRALLKNDVDALNQMGVTIKKHPTSNIVDIQKTAKGYTLLDDDGYKKDSDFVILATGHWQGQYDSRKKWSDVIQPSPWPAERLKSIPSNKPVAVLGTGLSAVDACMTLAHNAGRFEKRGEETVFIPKNENFQIHCYSRSGMLPDVLGNVYDANQNVIDLLESLPEPDDRRISLQEAYTLIRNAMLAHIPQKTKLPLNKKIREVLQKNPKMEDAARAWEEEYRLANTDPSSHLEQQITEARKSFQKNNNIWYQDLLRTIAPYAEDIFARLSGEEQDYFMKHIQPLCNKLAFGMVISNAEKMHALLKSNVLQLHEAGDNYALSVSDNKVQIHYQERDGKPHDDEYGHMVRATGDDPYKLRE